MKRRFIHINPDRSISLQEENLPAPRPDQALIKVHGIGINRGDLLQRQGLYPPPADASPILGLEVSGEIVGSGEKVCALTHGAGYCDYTLVPRTQCLPIPSGVSLLEAAALPEAAFTVWHNVFQRCQLKAGETFLVHGGASGIGSLAIQMAKAFGARVYATAGSEDKCSACKKLGATHAINYQREDFETILKDLEPRGVDVILDMAGGDFIPKNIRLAATDGRIASIAFVRGSKVEVNFTPVLMKRLTLTASTLRAQSLESKNRMAGEILNQVWPKVSAGQIRPVIDSVFDFQDVEKAHQRMMGGAHVGKILLRV